MKKNLFVAITAACILCSFCACGAEKPEEPATEQTAGMQNTTGIKEIPEDFRWLTYEEYKALSAQQQQAYYQSFPTPEEYMIWFNAVAKEHNQSDEKTEADGNEGQITQPTEPEEKPDDDPATPTQKPEAPTQQPEDPTTEPESPTQKPTSGSQEKKDPVLLTYEEYLALSPALQQAYCESFSSMDAYMKWFNEVAKEYNKGNNSSQVDGNQGQITQPTEQEQEQPTNPEEETTAPSHVDGFGSVNPDGR